MLTYFSGLPISIGDIVLVPFRSKTIHALVTDVKDVSAEKTSIKGLGTGVRKVSRVLQNKIFSDALIKAAQETARFFASSTGVVLASLIPVPLLKKISGTGTYPTIDAHREVRALQTDDEDRFSRYRSLVRESFGRKESVLCIVPTIQDADTVSEALSKGIAEYTTVLHSERPPREFARTTECLRKADHPILIVSTPGFSGLLLPYAGTVILERENSNAYRQLVRPFLDFRFFIKTFAQKSPTRLILGDSLLSSETLFRLASREYEELLPLKWRAGAGAEISLVDMREYKPNIRGKVQSVSKELSESIAASGKTFIFTVRRGLAPITLCGDCGSILPCKKCGHPVVLYKTAGNRRAYLCNRCGEKMETSVRCGVCTSWKLTTLGIGTQLVEEDLAERFPSLKIVRLDRESAKDRRHVLEVIKDFYESSKAVLIGTELAIPYLTQPLDSVAVASIDELLSIPNFRINERIVYLLLKLRSLSEERFIVQTRVPDNPAIQAGIGGTAQSFLNEELAMRKSLDYPPFSVLIKVTLHGKPAVIDSEMQKLATEMLPLTMDVFPVFEKGRLGTMGLSGVAKIHPKEWPNERVLALLRSLPLSAEIQVNPESFS